jgi:signal transduction histidine kinase
MAAIAAALAASGNSSPYAWLDALARAVLVGAPIAAGIEAWRHAAYRRYGTLLVATGCVAFVACLSESSDSLVYSIGRVGGWCVEPLVLLLFVSVPTGRVRSRVDRELVRATAAVIAVLCLPTALLVEQFPLPTPWTDCHAGCPGNAFMLTSSEPGFVDAIVGPVRGFAVLALMTAVVVRVVLRLFPATPLARRTLAPVAAIACFHLAGAVAAVSAHAVDADSGVIDVLIWSLPAAIPLLALVFVVGLANWRFFTATAVERLAVRLSRHPHPEELRDALAQAFADPSLEVVYPVNGGIRAPAPGGPRTLTEIRDGDRVIAGVIHDSALAGEHAFIDAATAYAMLTIDNHRLAAEAAALLEEVDDSRARIQASADDERRRIERDLHDGAQQRLVALRIKLELAAERVDEPSGDILRQLGDDVDGALDEVRSLARGIYPPPLADRGLAEALRSAALQAALPATVLAAGVRERYPRELESAAYFCCVEALQNAAKHARGASAAVIELSEDGVLRFEVRDDGAGFDPDTTAAGIGFTNMRDRIAAVGGELAIVSSPGRGARVVGMIPLEGRLPRAVRTRSRPAR